MGNFIDNNCFLKQHRINKSNEIDVSKNKLYLEKEYKKYLIVETMKSQKIILNSVGLNLEYTLKDVVSAGSSIASERYLYRLTSQIRKDGIAPELKLLIDNELNRYMNYSKWILGMCLSADGNVICQYDNIQMHKIPQIWYEDWIGYNKLDRYFKVM